MVCLCFTETVLLRFFVAVVTAIYLLRRLNGPPGCLGGVRITVKITLVTKENQGFSSI